MGRVDEKSVFKWKHDLLYNIRELASGFVQWGASGSGNNILPNAFHYRKEWCLILQHKNPSDDCWYETCENATLLWAVVKLNLTKLGKNRICHCIVENPLELMNYSNCRVNDFNCISGQCAQCPGSNLTHDFGQAILNIQVISYYRWETIDKHLKKVPFQ